MKILTGLLILAASLQPYIVWADSDAADAAAAASSAAASEGGDAATAVAAAAATATTYNSPSAHISCNCERIYKPVCCSDGRTYSNKCIVECINEHRIKHGLEPIHIKSHRECPSKPCNCPASGKPICGSDGHIYGNDCYFECENRRRELLCLSLIEPKHPSECRLPTCICPKDVIPVCGTDGRTYRNICVLQCVSRHNHANCKPGIGVKCEGACEHEHCICPLVVDPHCCSDGKTYNNLCHVQCENRKRHQLGKGPLTVHNKGECVECRCLNIYDPVCASNGHTFANPCTLWCENKRRKAKGLELLTIDSHSVCPCKCKFEYKPVCGSDYRTYPNNCKLRCENKRRSDLGMARIYIASEGRCECRCGHCSRKYEPVCGSDGRSYWNECWFWCNRCCSDIGFRPDIMYKGPC